MNLNLQYFNLTPMVQSAMPAILESEETSTFSAQTATILICVGLAI